MQAIPTFALMNSIDPELDVAKRRLAAYFDETKGSTGYGRSAAGQRSHSLSYLCSIPRRYSSGDIRYVHIFQPDRVTAGDAYFSVAASPRWWPVGCVSLQPQCRSEGRAALRLVS